VYKRDANPLMVEVHACPNSGTQAKAAAKIGIKRHNLSAYEEGRSTPDPQTFAQIARAFGIDHVGFADEKDFKMN
jgi:transcriptional regulator with XRE-family HTH domain